MSQEPVRLSVIGNPFYIVPTEEDWKNVSNRSKIKDREDKEWYDEMIKKNHIPILTADGDLDNFVCDYDYHNGPGCSRCNENWCQHCANHTDIKECQYLEIEEQKRIREEKKLDSEYPEYLRLKEKFSGVY